MKHKPQPSDEEIQRYMNFDRLLENSRKASNASGVTSMLKWTVPVLAVAVAIVGFFLVTNNSSTPVQDQQQFENPDASQNPAFPTRIDSIPEAEEITKIIRPKESKNVPPAVSDNSSQESTIKKESEAEVKDSGYVQAEPLNGYADLYYYFNTNLVYPPEALKDSVQGVQTISFVINTEGKPEQIEVVKSLGNAFEKESKRLIENMPEWKPATLNGKPVASKISLPLTFQIQKIKN